MPVRSRGDNEPKQQVSLSGSVSVWEETICGDPARFRTNH